MNPRLTGDLANAHRRELFTEAEQAIALSKQNRHNAYLNRLPAM
jgi:hypothetical protein